MASQNSLAIISNCHKIYMHSHSLTRSITYTANVSLSRSRSLSIAVCVFILMEVASYHSLSRAPMNCTGSTSYTLSIYNKKSRHLNACKNISQTKHTKCIAAKYKGKNRPPVHPPPTPLARTHSLARSLLPYRMRILWYSYTQWLSVCTFPRVECERMAVCMCVCVYVCLYVCIFPNLEPLTDLLTPTTPCTCTL